MQISLSLFNRSFSVKVIHVLLVLLLAGAAIRFYKLDYTGLWLDELGSMRIADPSFTLKDLYEISKADQPPATFIILHGWVKLFGYTDLAGRSLTVIYGLLGILAMFFLGREFRGDRLGLLAAFLTTINWFHVGVSVEI